MFYKAQIEIDPSHETVVDEFETNEFYNKVMKSFQNSNLGKNQEHETFTTINILHQIQMGLNKLKVDNIIRLTIDNNDFYIDQKGVEADLNPVIEELTTNVGPLETSFFDKIDLIGEHKTDKIKYFFQIFINRRHHIGEYPILVKVWGLFEELKSFKPDMEDLEEKLSKIFEDSDTYGSYLNSNFMLFQNFVSNIRNTLTEEIEIDDFREKYNQCLILNPYEIDSPDHIPSNEEAEIIFHDYKDLKNYMHYAYNWYQPLSAMGYDTDGLLLYDIKGNLKENIG